MDIKRSLAHMTAGNRTLDKKVLAMKKSWDDVDKLIANVGPGKNKKTSEKKSGDKNKK